MGQNGFATLSPTDLTPESIALWLDNAIAAMWDTSLISLTERTVLNEIVAPARHTEQVSSRLSNAVPEAGDVTLITPLT
jgi:hypothetical protein